jgi:glycosyltransferase involved in cell wall biosynthesis
VTRVLVVTADVLRAQIAGPAIRVLHICQGLAEEGHQVRLITTSPYCEVSPEGFTAVAGGPDELAEAEYWCEVMVLQGYVTQHYPVLARSTKIIVFDIYDPLHLETLALTKGHSGPARDEHVRISVETLNRQLERGDFLICASERQRDLFIGQLCALGRANAVTYDADPTLRRLIDVVPFGLPDERPEHRRAVLRGVVPGIGQSDEVLVWAGGIYDWFDPLTLIRAMSGLSRRRPSVRLYFMGLRHPNPDVPPMQMAIDAQALAEELGLAGRNVFFNQGWVDYAERQNFLLEANIGVSLHFDSAETRFSFRTRALDYLWAGLPIVATRGDSFAELIERERLGLTVPAEDPNALEEALFELLTDWEMAEGCRARVSEVRDRFRWSAVLQPLAAFCREPRPAPDLAAAHTAPAPSAEPPLPGGKAVEVPANPSPGPAGAGKRSFSELVRFHYQQGGVLQVVRSAANKAVRLARRT